MALITIVGVAMPMRNTYSIPMEDLEAGDTARSESGVLVRHRVRQGICKLDLAWRLGGADAATLLSAIVPSKVTVAYYDPRTGTTSEADMYVESRSCSMVRYTESESPEDILWDISFSLVQY